jgi:hypothetical protein
MSEFWIRALFTIEDILPESETARTKKGDELRRQTVICSHKQQYVRVMYQIKEFVYTVEPLITDTLINEHLQ